jgi:cytoskeletal protein RodZ
MRTVGQILKDERERKLYSLDDIEKSTKIRKELLQALEADDYAKLPPPTFVQGFIKNYGKFLGLDTEKLLAIFRREFSDRKNPPRIMDAWRDPITHSRFNLTPAKFISTLVISLILIFFAYLWYEYRFLVGAPFLEVTQPADQITVTQEIVRVQGRTDSEVRVTINNQDVLVDPQGRFIQDVKISENVTKLTIEATSRYGKSSKVERTLFLKQ